MTLVNNICSGVILWVSEKCPETVYILIDIIQIKLNWTEMNVIQRSVVTVTWSYSLLFLNLLFLLLLHTIFMFANPSDLFNHTSTHVTEICVVLHNPSSLLTMSSCFATLSTMRQSVTKPPASGPLSNALVWPRTDREHLCHCLCLIR